MKIEAWKVIICCVLLSFSSALFAQERVYQTVDEEGNVAFSDKPKKGAKPIEVAPLQTFEIMEIEPSSPRETTTAEKSAKYESLAITQPKNEQTIWNNPGNFSVVISVSPPLSSNDKLVLLLDGEPVKESTAENIEELSFHLENIDRGTHLLQAKIVNKEGQPVITSDTVTVQLHQTSVNRPARRPARRPGRR